MRITVTIALVVSCISLFVAIFPGTAGVRQELASQQFECAAVENGLQVSLPDGTSFEGTSDVQRAELAQKLGRTSTTAPISTLTLLNWMGNDGWEFASERADERFRLRIAY